MQLLHHAASGHVMLDATIENSCPEHLGEGFAGENIHWTVSLAVVASRIPLPRSCSSTGANNFSPSSTPAQPSPACMAASSAEQRVQRCAQWCPLVCEKQQNCMEQGFSSFAMSGSDLYLGSSSEYRTFYRKCSQEPKLLSWRPS